MHDLAHSPHRENFYPSTYIVMVLVVHTLETKRFAISTYLFQVVP
jgi:hypothetical protein